MKSPFAPFIPFDHPANLANEDGTLKGTTPQMNVLGIDVGATGAIALLGEGGTLLDVWDMPCLRDGPKNRRTINGPLLAELVYKSHAQKAFVERVGPRPKEGAVGAFQFGDCKGVIRGVLAAAAIPTIWISPPQWKRVANIPPGKDQKDMARSVAIARWPAHADKFALKKDDGRAEAALIGLAGLLRFMDVVELVPLTNLQARGRA
jgi:crossover junction endodeoxyribonuclease RuvC